MTSQQRASLKELSGPFPKIPLKYGVDRRTEKIDEIQEGYLCVSLDMVEKWTGEVMDEKEDPESLSSGLVQFKPGEVLFNKLRPYLAKAFIADSMGAASPEFLVFEPIKFIPEYLLYLFLSEEFVDRVDASTYGAKMPRASWDFIGDLYVPCPDSSTQEQIVSFLNYHTSKIDGLIKNKKELVDLLEEKRRTLIHQAVTKGFDDDTQLKTSEIPWVDKIPESWSLKPIRGIIEKRNEMNDPIQETHILSVVRGKGVIPYDERGASGNKATDELEKYQIVHSGDIVANRMNLLIGSSGVASERGICSPEYFVLNPKSEEVSPEYLSYVFLDEMFLEWLSHYGKGIQNLRERVYWKDLRSEPIPIPPRETQEKIAQTLENELHSISKLSDALNNSIALLTERRKALITKAVTGELDISEWEKPEEQELTV